MNKSHWKIPGLQYILGTSIDLKVKDIWTVLFPLVLIKLNIEENDCWIFVHDGFNTGIDLWNNNYCNISSIDGSSYPVVSEPCYALLIKVYLTENNQKIFNIDHSNLFKGS